MKAIGAPPPKNPYSRVAASASAGNRKRKMGTSPPTTVELRGLSVHFPFEPYKCQEEYMGKVLDALLKSENALLESPTGTGKTLCLLCATLAWQRNQAKLLQDASALQLSQARLNPSSGDNFSTTINPSQAASKRVPTIIYASRTHSQLSQVVRELRNTRYRPKHAVLGSREQMCVHPKVKKATATSADINHDCNALAKERKCKYRNELERFNAPTDGNDGNNNQYQAVLDMEDLVKMGKENRICPFYYTRSLLPEAELVLMPYNYLFDKDSRDTTLKDINWNGAVVIFDEAHNLESFATESASFDLTQTDIAICIAEINRACNYVQMSGGDDEGLPVKAENLVRMKSLFLRFEDYVNNLERSGAFSGEMMMELFTQGMGINHANHQLFVEESRKINELLLDVRGGGGGSGGKGAPKLEHFVQCIKRVFGEPTEGRCMAKAKSYRVHVSPKASSAAATDQQQNRGGASRNKTAAATRTISYWCFAPSLSMQELHDLKIRSILVTSGTLSPLPSYSIELGLPFPITLENPHIISNEQIHVRVIGKGVSGKELTSSFQRRKDAEYYIELGNTLVSLAKVIPGGMLIFFPSYGVMETCLERWGGPSSSSSRYNNNSNPQNKFFAARKGGKSSRGSGQQFSFPYTAPSLYGSTLTASGTNTSTPWKRLLGAKSVVVEPKSTADLADAMSEFQKFLDMPKSKGCILMGVCRGKISEGIDFSNNMSRAVVITGLPFPPAFDPKVKLKREYLDTARANNNFKTKEEGGFHGDPKMPGTDTKKSTLSGHEWYSQQAHRAVNQAIGRVIRNRHDYGAVLLLDSRYSQPVNHQGLSKWLRPHILPDEGVGAAIGSLSKFYRQAETKVKELEQTNKGKVLEFEQEEEDRLRKQKQQRKLEERENAFTKVAFVQNLNRNLKQGKADLKPVSAPKKGEVATGGEENDTDHPVSFIAPDRVIARVDVTAMATKKEEVFTKQDSAETTVRSTGNESVFNWSRGNQGGGMKSMPSSKPTKKVSKPDSKQVAAQFFKKAQAMLSPQDLASLKKSIVSLKMFGDQKDDKAYLKAARGVINLCSRYEEFFHEQYDKTMLYLFFHLVARPFKRKVELVAMKGLYRSSALGHLCKENLHPESLEKIQTMFPYFLRPLWCSVDEDEEITLDKSKFLKEAQKILAILKVSEQNALTSKMVDAFTSLVPSRFVAATRALVAEMKASQNIRRMKASENSAKKGEDAIDAFRFQKPAAAFKVEGSSEGKPTKQEALQNDNKTEQPSAVKKEPSAKDEKIEATNKPSMKSGSKVTEKSAISTARTTQAFGAKPRTLTSLIGRANAPNQTKEASANDKSKVLSNKRGNSVDSKLGAPPAYSRHSKNISQANSSIPQKKEVVGAKNDAVTEMLVEAESQPYMKKTAGDIVQSLNSNVPANMACVMCHDKAQIPLIGECGHLACKTCWLLWLAKAPVCPICRVAVVKESLARIVFRDDGERQSGAAPTLSQLCED